MKLKAGQKVHYDSGPNMTPLVDIVMVILIFLMLTGTFAAGEHFLQSNLPLQKEGMGLKDKPNVPKDEQLEIRVDSFNVTGASGQTEPVWVAVVQGSPQIRNDRVKLEQTLKTIRANYAANNISDDKVQVVIKPTSNTKYKHLIEVYQAALGAELKKVAFAQSRR